MIAKSHSGTISLELNGRVVIQNIINLCGSYLQCFHHQASLSCPGRPSVLSPRHKRLMSVWHTAFQVSCPALTLTLHISELRPQPPYRGPCDSKNLVLDSTIKVTQPRPTRSFSFPYLRLPNCPRLRHRLSGVTFPPVSSFLLSLSAITLCPLTKGSGSRVETVRSESYDRNCQDHLGRRIRIFVRPSWSHSTTPSYLIQPLLPPGVLKVGSWVVTKPLEVACLPLISATAFFCKPMGKRGWPTGIPPILDRQTDI